MVMAAVLAAVLQMVAAAQAVVLLELCVYSAYGD
jgi:hypothetical protein